MRNTTGLSQIDLSKIHFSAASPKTANVEDPYDYYFDGINCAGVTLREAILDDGSFKGANFTRANLSYASIARASLKAANLTDATLIGAIFLATDLQDAEFSGAEVGDAAFLRVDLTELHGIEATRHRFGSIIDTSTLQLTAKKLRKYNQLDRNLILNQIMTFLSDCGMPAPFISAFRAMAD